MASVQDLKRRIRSVRNTQKITRAMELVAAAQLRRAELRIRALRPYAMVKEQLELVRQAVLRYKDHPAVLMWGIGNEMEGYGDGDRPVIWKHVNEAAKLAKSLDTNHPVMTVIAELGGKRIQSVNEYCPDVDIVGINTYAGAAIIGLTAILDVAQPGARILMVSFGSGAGSHAFSITVTDQINQRRNLAPLTRNYIDRRTEIDYATYARMRQKLVMG